MKFRIVNKFVALTSILFLLALGGCKKFLDQQPITEVGSEMVFKDVNTTLQALAGVYNRVAGDNGFGLKLALHYPVDEDILMGPTGNNDDRRAMAHFSLTTGNSELPAPFNQLFEGIMLANICIDEIPKMAMYSGGSDQEQGKLRRMHGEALALRAQFYFEALRNWGDLPEHFLPSYIQAGEEPYPVRIDRDLIYDRILEDLELAITLVPWQNELTNIGDAVNERLTKGAIKGLRARIALFRGGYSLRQSGTMQRPSNYTEFYQIARTEANEIITSANHSLFPNYRGLWKDVVCAHRTIDANAELMFQVSAIGAGGVADSKFGYANGPRVDGRGNSFVNPLPHYFYLFDSTDTRRDVTIAPYDVMVNGTTKIGQNSQNFRDGKYRRDWITNPSVSPTSAVQYFGLKWQLLRYADVLLMFAEAENELNGPTAAAYNAINMVRRRGFGKPIATPDATVDIPAGLNKADFFKYLVRERALELGGEGVRKYDLIRWNLLATALTEAKAVMTIMGNRSGTISYTYMAGPPAYATNPATLPQTAYFIRTSNDDDSRIWAHSLYLPTPAAQPANTTGVNWVHSSIRTGIVTSSTRYAFGFVAGKSELFPIPQPARDANPNLTQNPGY